MKTTFHVIKNRNPHAKRAGVPDINTLPCAKSIQASITRTRRSQLLKLVNDPVTFTEFFASDDQGQALNLQSYQKEFLRRIAETEAKERRDDVSHTEAAGDIIAIEKVDL